MTATKPRTGATAAVDRITAISLSQFLRTVSVRVIESEKERLVTGIVTVCTCKTNNTVLFTSTLDFKLSLFFTRSALISDLKGMSCYRFLILTKYTNVTILQREGTPTLGLDHFLSEKHN